MVRVRIKGQSLARALLPIHRLCQVRLGIAHRVSTGLIVERIDADLAFLDDGLGNGLGGLRIKGGDLHFGQPRAAVIGNAGDALPEPDQLLQGGIRPQRKHPVAGPVPAVMGAQIDPLADRRGHLLALDELIKDIAVRGGGVAGKAGQPAQDVIGAGAFLAAHGEAGGGGILILGHRKQIEHRRRQRQQHQGCETGDQPAVAPLQMRRPGHRIGRGSGQLRLQRRMGRLGLLHLAAQLLELLGCALAARTLRRTGPLFYIGGLLAGRGGPVQAAALRLCRAGCARAFAAGAELGGSLPARRRAILCHNLLIPACSRL